jgi:hypothetical protein
MRMIGKRTGAHVFEIADIACVAATFVVGVLDILSHVFP